MGSGVLLRMKLQHRPGGCQAGTLLTGERQSLHTAFSLFSPREGGREGGLVDRNMSFYPHKYLLLLIECCRRRDPLGVISLPVEIGFLKECRWSMQMELPLIVMMMRMMSFSLQGTRGTISPSCLSILLV